MKKYPEISKHFDDSADGGMSSAMNSAVDTNRAGAHLTISKDEDEASKQAGQDGPEDSQLDSWYQSKVVKKEWNRYQQILKVLQTGAICHVDDQLFFKKNGANFVDFALKYLFG